MKPVVIAATVAFGSLELSKRCDHASNTRTYLKPISENPQPEMGT